MVHIYFEEKLPEFSEHPILLQDFTIRLIHPTLGCNLAMLTPIIAAQQYDPLMHLRGSAVILLVWMSGALA